MRAQTYDPQRAQQLMGTQQSAGGNTLTNRSREENLRALVRRTYQSRPLSPSLSVSLALARYAARLPTAPLHVTTSGDSVSN